MSEELRKLAERIFELSYVPIWGIEDKELRIQRYEQILEGVKKSHMPPLDAEKVIGLMDEMCKAAWQSGNSSKLRMLYNSYQWNAETQKLMNALLAALGIGDTSVPFRTDEDGNTFISGVLAEQSSKRVQGKDTLSGDLENVIAIGEFEVVDPEGKYLQTTVDNVHTFELKGDGDE